MGNDFEDIEITTVSGNAEKGWTVGTDSVSFFLPSNSPIEPEPGMTARIYSKGLGSRIRGLYIEGECIFYRTEAEDEEHFLNETYGEDAAALLAKWDAGQVCHTIEMGGIGPGYEQIIHIIVFEMVRYMLANPVDWESVVWKDYRSEMDKELFKADAPCEKLGPSGAQYGAALNLAAYLVRHGPRAVMEDEGFKDRHIMVSKKFP